MGAPAYPREDALDGREDALEASSTISDPQAVFTEDNLCKVSALGMRVPEARNLESLVQSTKRSCRSSAGAINCLSLLLFQKLPEEVPAIDRILESLVQLINTSCWSSSSSSSSGTEGCNSLQPPRNSLDEEAEDRVLGRELQLLPLEKLLCVQ